MAGGGVYEEVEIEDMVWSEEDMAFKYPCPCGDTFFITVVRLATYTAAPTAAAIQRAPARTGCFI